MRIAYIAPYQGPDLLKRRPIVRNRSMAAVVKIEMAASLLQEKSHTLEIISQGEVIDAGCKFYPAFAESQRFHPEIPIYYASAVRLRFVTGFWEEWRALQLFKSRHKAARFDAVIIYNTKRAQLACANYALDRLGLPVLLDFEDDPFVNVTGDKPRGARAAYHVRACLRVLSKLSGCYGVSPHLLSHLPAGVPKVLMRGLVEPAIVKTSQNGNLPKKNWVSFAGTHTKSNGLAQLMDAWKTMMLPDWELHLAGFGEDTAALQKRAEGRSDIVFHGVLRGQALADLLCSSKICISPNEASRTPGNIFPCKIIDYLAAGAHVVAVPMGPLEKEFEEGITYLPSNDPEAISNAVQQVIRDRRWEHSVAPLVWETFGPAAAGDKLENLLQQACRTFGKNPRAAAGRLREVL
jgi:glycosyltransferase involved in cell wall biosynthesis